MPDVFCLSMHAQYRCADAGLCCTTGWPIRIDRAGGAALAQALAAGRVAARGAMAPLGPDGLVAADSGGCVFHDRHVRACAIHRAIGHQALPLACRQFPRVTVQDPRGVAVRLSHYCPTAAALLAIDAPVFVIKDAPAFPPDGEYVGLDATDVLPPLLKRDVLMDWESWWECERLTVELFANTDRSPVDALASVVNAVREMQRWTPASGTLLRDHVRESFANATPGTRDLSPPAVLLAGVASALPDAPASGGYSHDDGVIRRYLAAHAFANWEVYGRGGLDAWLRSIELAHALVAAGLRVGVADLQLLHRSI